MIRALGLAVLLIALSVLGSGCAITYTPVTPAPCSASPGDTHNSCGGYIPACGLYPPIVGDDC